MLFEDTVPIVFAIVSIAILLNGIVLICVPVILWRFKLPKFTDNLGIVETANMVYRYLFVSIAIGFVIAILPLVFKTQTPLLRFVRFVCYQLIASV